MDTRLKIATTHYHFTSSRKEGLSYSSLLYINGTNEVTPTRPNPTSRGLVPQGRLATAPGALHRDRKLKWTAEEDACLAQVVRDMRGSIVEDFRIERNRRMKESRENVGGVVH